MQERKKVSNVDGERFVFKDDEEWEKKEQTKEERVWSVM